MSRPIRAGGGGDTAMTIVEILLAVFLPPLSVFFTDGCGCQFLLNILLTCLGWFPGAVHALWRIKEQRERNRAAGVALGTPASPAAPLQGQKY